MPLSKTPEADALFHRLTAARTPSKNVLSFQYRGQEFSVAFSPDPSVQEYMENSVKIIIEISQNSEINGKITGYLRIEDSKRVFDALLSRNNHMRTDLSYRRLGQDEGHVPLLIHETIVQLLTNTILHTWRSSLVTYPGAKKMYQNLMNDPRIVGIKEDLALSNRWVLTKRLENN